MTRPIVNHYEWAIFMYIVIYDYSFRSDVLSIPCFSNEVAISPIWYVRLKIFNLDCINTIVSTRLKLDIRTSRLAKLMNTNQDKIIMVRTDYIHLYYPLRRKFYPSFYGRKVLYQNWLSRTGFLKYVRVNVMMMMMMMVVGIRRRRRRSSSSS